MAQQIVIAGSGFAGLGLGIRLKKAGIHDFVIHEKSNQLGGVWRDNTYPGVACDVPAHLYSYSFEPNPTWTRLFAPQSEILAYLERCADKYGLRSHLRFDDAITSATFDERSGTWDVATTKGKTKARVLVSASGHALTRPILAEVPGAETFRGKIFHSARWDHSFDLTGKRVAIIGTGASAIQIVPNIVKRVGKLVVYQRTAPWVLPRPEVSITKKAQALFARRPLVQKALRGAIYGFMESLAVGFVVDPRFNRLRERAAKKFLAESVPDPALRARLTPQFTLGCKRILYSHEWYPALQQPHVSVVTDRIREITPRGIVDASGTEHEVDAIIMATGFEAAEAAAPFALRGKDGLAIEDAWKNGIRAYLGTSISGFPNFFMMLGPNTGLGHSSMIYMMESQMNYLVDAIETMRDRDLRWIDVKPEVMAAYNDELQAKMKGTVWAQGGCQSWYQTKDGKNTTLWPGFTFQYRRRTRHFDLENYATATEAAARAVPGVTAPLPT
jgi:cation diffusion facilitator CzcD-associated flavoprotein CzcO